MFDGSVIDFLLMLTRTLVIDSILFAFGVLLWVKLEFSAAFSSDALTDSSQARLHTVSIHLNINNQSNVFNKSTQFLK